MKVNKNQRLNIGAGFIPILVKIAIPIVSGLILNWTWSQMAVKSEAQCTTAYNNSWNAIVAKELNPDTKEKLKLVLTGIYLCCVQGKGSDYQFDWKQYRCVGDNSNK